MSERWRGFVIGVLSYVGCFSAWSWPRSIPPGILEMDPDATLDNSKTDRAGLVLVSVPHERPNVMDSGSV